jgi:hypothetical protein
MLSDLPNQVSSLKLDCLKQSSFNEAFVYFSGSRAAHEFAATIWTNRIHRSRAIATERAFVNANEGFALSSKRASALLALFFHFQSHIKLSGVESRGFEFALTFCLVGRLLI